MVSCPHLCFCPFLAVLVASILVSLWWCSGVKILGQCGSCSASSVYHAVGWQLVLTSGEFRVDLGFYAHFTFQQHAPRISRGVYSGCRCGGPRRRDTETIQFVLGVLCSGGGIGSCC